MTIDVVGRDEELGALHAFLERRVPALGLVHGDELRPAAEGAGRLVTYSVLARRP